MTAISKAYVTLTDAATDADSPVDQALVQGLRDNLVHLREWLGASYTAGAVQNHNHDGVNSALVEVGPNAIRNGSFEADLDSWTAAAYTGGTVASNTAQNMDGAKCLAITSTVLANGGGTATSDEFRSCAAGDGIFVKLDIKASAVNISSLVEVVWFDEAQNQISTSTVYSSTNTPTAAAAQGNAVTAPATACYYKIKLTGGVPGTGAAVGTVYFDGIVAGAITQFPYGYSTAAVSGTSTAITGVPPWANHLELSGEGLSQASLGAQFGVRIGDSGGIETSGYLNSSSASFIGLSTVSSGGGNTVDFHIIARRQPGTNTWDFSGWTSLNDAAGTIVSGRKTLSATLDRADVYGSGGTMDAGLFTATWRA